MSTHQALTRKACDLAPYGNANRKVRTHIRAVAGIGAAVALTASLAACGSSSKGSAGGANTGAQSAVVTQAGSGTRLSGAYSGLEFWGWVPDGMYPSDISEIPDGEYNTDQTVKVNDAHDLATESCTQVLDTAGGPGYGENSYMIDQGENSAETNFYTYGAAQYPSAADATAYLKELATRFTQCGQFTADNNGTSFPASLAVGPSSEAAAVAMANTAVDLRESASNQGHTVTGDLLVAADGNVVVFETESSTTGALPNVVSLPKLADVLLAAFTQGEAQDSAASPAASGAGAPSSTPAPGAGTGAGV
jgi:PknH-like extracellular domain